MAQDTNRRSIISRRPSINTQAETKAANIWWKLCNIWGVEAQVFSIHGPTGQHFSTIASKNRKSNNRVLTDAELLVAATTLEEGEKWTQLCNNLKYILISITSGAAATVWAWKSTGNFATGLQYLLEQEALDTSQNFSNQDSTTTTLKSPSQHGNLSLPAMSVTTVHNYQTRWR